MDIIGIGTDIVEVERIAAVLARHAESFNSRLLTEKELALAAKKGNPATFYAGRWAAKEACAKALGCGIGASCNFTDIEILNDVSGKPQITLTGSGKSAFEHLGGKKIMLSISHERHYAVATVIISG